ncbi:hypothetical protein L1987_86960 [Smallanthus sonchifolius]|uniref:Uncharacterized protein n=1 Tax=Smallanthus sonchifolius TaxID=185202 RepID=A0ACB8Y200_9ASTR|nr:hypothetical protein L1987_86960 [Smallanthus sonchifolius]
MSYIWNQLLLLIIKIYQSISGSGGCTSIIAILNGSSTNTPNQPTFSLQTHTPKKTKKQKKITRTNKERRIRRSSVVAGLSIFKIHHWLLLLKPPLQRGVRYARNRQSSARPEFPAIEKNLLEGIKE